MGDLTVGAFMYGIRSVSACGVALLLFLRTVVTNDYPANKNNRKVTLCISVLSAPSPLLFGIARCRMLSQARHSVKVLGKPSMLRLEQRQRRRISSLRGAFGLAECLELLWLGSSMAVLPKKSFVFLQMSWHLPVLPPQAFRRGQRSCVPSDGC